MYINTFINITSRAWALPILARLQEGVPGRQAPLLKATGASRSAFALSMTHLIEIGLVERSSGYGHPLRPEFRLTLAGEKSALLASDIILATGGRDQDLLRRTWVLPILASLNQDDHFNQIRHRLSNITDRALSHSLKSLEERVWVLRCVDRVARPPRSEYRAVNTGLAISQITGAVVELDG
ncbi:transcriptional regulator [Sedimentitalea sp. CY04]|uniref:Transcriptional regulator n=1 Tax=Parasedimentitalea denitrificans TaxID=2211118 RepID=A0ABX0W900_9RHOB|nr:winged helix-turn-helix transcriptional regulator [Sedimentitalea sp. CY04]NIZ62110.1 transcriptional regulator [Sedimentitalea sp. CY04]